MADSSQDRTLPATPRRIAKAREDGQVARSRDLGHFAAFAAGALALAGAAPLLGQALLHILSAGLRFDLEQLAGTRPMLERLGELGLRFAIVVLLVGLLMMAVAVASGALAGGLGFTWKALAPRFGKLDPLAGLGRMVSGTQLGQAAKACALALVLGGVGALFLWHSAPRFLHGLQLPLPAAGAHLASALWAGFLLLLMCLGAFALVDVPLQRFVWLRQLRMSHAEVKQEHKELEGNAEVKSKMRVRMREMANKRMLAAVPNADLVVMNPTHFAVALKYDAKTMAAPRVVAKGADLMAMRIRDAAQAAQVPVLQAPPLARALYAHAEVDREIPAALFSAVAQVLAWVYQLRASRAGRGAAPADLPPLDVPAELDPQNGRQAGGEP